ncbi:hypothetical protein FZ025_10395 [Xanthomonas hyacinthi]|uniref:hypothetical protein n=1 Tax=Xanthomonas hyacinthi TaxID=56455 RepID=UPI0011B0982F|nr:hypothetical protein [Xanthomonas hyacinthi]QGY77026.1 hypothetical protein FZ025_10370 [Xanthomonas hyacinthi]QGY77029.1 hypothetical protein FZ025_10395 [Xanthomonas hyacinthi]
MLRAIAFIVIFFACGHVYAVSYNIDGQTIASLSTGWVGEGLFVDTQGTLPSGANCGNGNRFLIEPGAPMQKEMVSLLLMAMQNKVPATLYVDGCSGGVMKLKSVSISKS